MKLKKTVFCSILVCLALGLGGCGETMYTLTDEEADEIALYSAKMVSKYNKNQSTGINNAIITDEEMGIVDTTGEEELSVGTELDEEGNPVESKTQSSSEISAGSTLPDMAVPDIDFSLDDYEVTDEYNASNVFVLDASAGHSYVILHLLASNNTDEDVDVDVLGSGNVYRLTVNKEATVTAQTTILTNDLSTYQGTIKAGETEELILVFEFKTSQVENIESLSLGVEAGAKKSTGNSSDKDSTDTKNTTDAKKTTDDTDSESDVSALDTGDSVEDTKLDSKGSDSADKTIKTTKTTTDSAKKKSSDVSTSDNNN